jgi:uncharacterized SAM-binding protein YcdF (DUF218 family)
MASRGGFGHSRTSRLVRRLLLLLLVVLIGGGGWLAGLFWFTGEMPDSRAVDHRPTDAIVVLTGGSERLPEGIRLLREGRAERLFVSGVYRGVDVSQLLEVTREAPSIENRIDIGHKAENTAGNAEETAAWMAEHDYHSLRLVTASYHMPRSLLEFHAAMPEVDIIPHAVFPAHVRQSEWWRWPGTSGLIMREYTKYLFARLRVWLAG